MQCTYTHIRIYILFVALYFPGVSVLAKDKSEDLQQFKKEALTAQGPRKAAILNQIAFIYISSMNYHADSALVYAENALHYSRNIHFKQGISNAIQLCARISLQLSMVNKGLEYYRLMRQMAIDNRNDFQEAYAVQGIGNALWYQGKFGQATDTIKLALELFHKCGAEKEIDDATMVLSGIYGDMGNYENAFEVAQRSLRLSTKSGDKANIVLSLVQMGYLYKNIGDYETALSYFQKAFAYNPSSFEWCYRHLCNRTGDLYLGKKDYDSAFYFFNQSLQSHAESKTSLLRMGEYWLALRQYDKALNYFNRVYSALKNGGEGNLIIFALLGMGKAAQAMNDPKKALRYGYEALGFAQQRDTRLTLRDAYQLLYTAYEDLHNGDSAFFYYKQFVREKDAVVTDQFKGRLYAYKQVSRIKLLENQKQMSDQKLEANKMLRNILMGGILVLLVMGMVIFWNISLKNKNEKLQHERIEHELKRRAAELEMQALRAQMNPHFIFNALSSVNRFILKNDPDKASDYLTRFSRLIRLVLVNSQKEVILLEEEIEMLRLYLQMEHLRFKNVFEYNISYSSNIDPGVITIPPLLVQPFCENAIWHGLMHKEGHGRLDIDFTMEEELLLCTITDNGIGRDRSAELGSKSAEKIKSLGLQLTSERLALFNEDRDEHTSYEIEDIKDKDGKVCGTRVKLQIRHHSFTGEKIYEPV